MGQKISVVWQSYYLSNVGFGEAARNYTLALNDAGNYKIKVFPYEELGAENINLIENEKGKQALSFVEEKITERPIWVTEMGPLQIHPTVGYSIGLVVWECYEWSKQFVDNLKKQDEIWCPAKFNKEALEKAGVKNVHLMPHAIDTDRFDPEKVEPARSALAKDRFVFLSIMGWSERKGASDLLEAYIKEFSKEDNTVLYLKINFVDVQRVQKRIATIRKQFGPDDGGPYIVIDPIIYSYKAFPGLYQMADAFVLPSRGEGWGLNFTEAMAMELPTIGTATTAMTDYMDETNSYPVKTKGFAIERMCDHICGDYIGKKFPVIDINDLRKQMRMVYADREEARKRAKKARQDIIKNYSFATIGKRMDKRMKEIWKNMAHFSLPAPVILKEREAGKRKEWLNVRKWWIFNIRKILFAKMYHSLKKRWYKYLSRLYSQIYESDPKISKKP